MAFIGNNLTISQYAPQIAYFSGNASTTAFTLPQAVVSSAQILVVVANVPQNPSSAYTVSGTTLTFTSAPPTGTNNVWVEYTSLQTNTIAPSAGTVQTSSFGSVTSIPFTGYNSIGTGNSSAMKNRIINGAMVIDQRNAGASVTPTVDGQYTLDRWCARLSVTSKFSVQQLSTSPPVGFNNYLGVTSLSAYSISALDYFFLFQKIEGFNFADCGWGTTNAKTVTLSFQVYSSLTGTFGGSIQNSAQNRAYPFTFTVSSANTWTSVSITVAGDTSGTWVGATNGTGVIINFGLGVGTTYSGTANSWQAGQYISATGATSVVGTSGATFYITGVQLEVGLNATGFEYRQYGTELLLCQRYYQKSYEDGTVPGAVTVNGLVGGYCTDAAGRGMSVSYQVPLRTAPTFSYWDGAGNATKYSAISNGAWTNNQSAAFQLLANSSKGFILSTTSTSATVTVFIQYTASAEL